MIRSSSRRVASLGAMLFTLALGVVPASAGYYKTIDVLDSSFSDWDDVPIAYTDAAGDSSAIDFSAIQLANDDSYLYLRVTYATAVNPNGGPSTYLAFDTDNNTATGFNIYGLGIVGSEAGFSNDFPFDQRTGYNVGGLSAGAGIAPYFTVTTSQEYRITRGLTYTSDNATVFGDSFTLMLWTDAGSADTTGGINYAFASVPEPTSLAAIGIIGVVLPLLRRRRTAI